MELEKYGVVELDHNQKKSTAGGWLGLAIALIGAGIYVYNNWDDFAAGFKEGANS